MANEVSREECRQPRQVSGGVGVTCGLLLSRLVQGGGSSSKIALIGEVVAGKEARANEARKQEPVTSRGREGKGIKG